jgi:hypothetical protein
LRSCAGFVAGTQDDLFRKNSNGSDILDL